MKTSFKLFSFLFMLAVLFIGCKKDEETPTTGFVNGKVVDANTGLALADVQLILFDANSNEPAGNSLETNADGNYSLELNPGNYYFKLYKQNYQEVPPRGFSALPFSITVGNTTEGNDYEMFPSAVQNGGIIQGTVKADGSAKGGVLVVAYNSTTGKGFSSVSNTNGEYSIYNVEAGSYLVKGFLLGYNSDELSVAANSGSTSTNQNITLSSNANGSLSGQVRFISVSNSEVDVTLTHPGTGEAIPGLSVRTTTQSFSMSGIPSGTYIARATYANDNLVMDPDRLIKFGEPVVVVANDAQTIDFDVTGAIQLTSPTNPAEEIVPFETSATPTFDWADYSATSDYVIEVSDANGNVIWGGFDNSGALPVKNIVIPKNQTSIAFNSDGKATAQLQVGRIYRWRVYASKDDQSETGWNLISVSEDQRGLIRIIE